MPAVPAAAKRRAEQDAAGLVAMGIDPTSPTPAAVQTGAVPAPAASPTPATPASPGPDSATAERELAELRQRVSTNDGRFTAVNDELAKTRQTLEVINQNRTFLEQTIEQQNAKINELTTQLEQATQRAVSGSAERVLLDLENAPGLTPEQKEQFGDDSVKFVNVLLAQQLAPVVKAIHARLSVLESATKGLEKLPGIEKQTVQVMREATAAREERFFQSEILAHFPDFKDVRTTQEWKTFVHTRLPTGQTNKDLLQSYKDAWDAEGLRRVIGRFYDSRPQRPSMDALAVPDKSTTDNSGTRQQDKPRMKASDYKTNQRAFLSKKLSKDQWEAFKAAYNEAVNEDRVDHDVVL